MFIKHVTIRNAGMKCKAGEIGCNYTYEVQIALSGTPDLLWRKVLHSEWRKEFLFRRRNGRLVENELRLLLEKDDDIQACIDVIKQMLEKVNYRYLYTHRDPSRGKLCSMDSVKKEKRYSVHRSDPEAG